MHVYWITFITVFYRLPGKSGASRAQTKQREQTFLQSLHRGATTVSTRREEQILGWYVTLEKRFGLGSGSCSSVFLFAEGCGSRMCLPSRETFAGGLNWWGCPSLGSHPTAPCQSFQHKAQPCSVCFLSEEFSSWTQGGSRALWFLLFSQLVQTNRTVSEKWWV